MMERGSSGWILCLVLGTLSAMFMSLVLVWVNIERMDTSYFINSLQIDIKEKKAHMAKLEVEREYLLSPFELGRRAEMLGLHQPEMGQVRWRDDISK